MTFNKNNPFKNKDYEELYITACLKETPLEKEKALLKMRVFFTIKAKILINNLLEAADPHIRLIPTEKPSIYFDQSHKELCRNLREDFCRTRDDAHNAKSNKDIRKTNHAFLKAQSLWKLGEDVPQQIADNLNMGMHNKANPENESLVEMLQVSEKWIEKKEKRVQQLTAKLTT